MTEIDPIESRALARVGTLLKDKWRLDRLLGVGGMAAVYEATHRNGKRAAVKVLHAELAAVGDVRARFLREGYVANAVGHPGAVSVLDDDIDDDGAVFLVMELLEGETVEALAMARTGGRLPLDRVVAIADALLDILTAAHGRGIVHRDLKPDNVFVGHDGEIHVLDFGIARLTQASASATTTRDGSAMGTPAFMPREQALGEWDAVDGRSDLWALGATMFTLLTGRFVHEAETAQKLLLAAMTKTAPPLRSIVPELAPAIAEVIDRALAAIPDERWPDARAMQEALRRACATTPPAARPLELRETLPSAREPYARTSTAVAVSSDSTPTPVTRRGAWLGLVAAAAGAAALGAWWLLHEAPPPPIPPEPAATLEAPASSPLPPPPLPSPPLPSPAQPSVTAAPAMSSVAPSPALPRAQAPRPVTPKPRTAPSTFDGRF
jgi:serine/threonine protein kinase